MRSGLAAGAVVLAVVLAGCSPAGTPQATPTSSSAGQSAAVSDVVDGLDVPWGLAFLPDGDAVVTLRDDPALVLVGPDGSTSDVTGPGADDLLDVVVPGGEGGLLGVAVLGAEGSTVDLALYATAADDNRVLRGTLDGSVLGELRPVLTGIEKAGNHNGGRLAVGPDGYLYVATGDAGDPSSAQDPDGLNGKILRITAEGDPAPGNPDEGSPVWSLGHRNVQGLGWAPDGRMFASEFGQSTWDELNVIEPGGNYGWPEVEGMGDGFVEPVAVWATTDASPSGLAVTDDAVYLAGLRGERLWRVPLTEDGVGTPEALLDGEHGRLRAVEPAPDGSLWVVTGNTDGRGAVRPGDDRILRLVVD
ncbi:PQQ-dependent sugar dehydrogenase [Cellulomonas fengjieae]|uniref:PQQ-dependent sugar dehydrogenase n=1 Tax=Cellulomonas fengjieae TaxID=2819978 RepID=A0ABS3SLH6_9CELL|nr:PQQ-dependent sugar dehydrogenase [Cellulomonas fengjieae]MBO3086572.1 PQQ-dependent sugar dehydrogenase [Cellulomonas fengjieae]QVI66574.1 PQQ-dependent sugar dehydrogenase [Cellulomonas fengjieae]